MSEINEEFKDEYLMLREEILHLDNITNNTINFFYAFIAAYIAFALVQEDTMFILLSYIGIIPPYLIVLNKMTTLCKIGAYLNVFHEGKSFNWERRWMKYKEKYESRFRVISWHLPFICVSLTVTGLLLYRTQWFFIEAVDIVKIIICFALLMIILCNAYRNRNINPKDFIDKWKQFMDDNDE